MQWTSKKWWFLSSIFWLKKWKNVWCLKKELIWSKDLVIQDLKENYVKIEENQKMLWYKWKKVFIDIPAVWKFKWFKFNCFVSYDRINIKDFESNPDFEKFSYSRKDISKALNSMNDYNELYELAIDKYTDYENDLQLDKSSRMGLIFICTAWDLLKGLLWLDYWYWLKNVDYDRIYWNVRAVWICFGHHCSFHYHGDDDNCANLLLKLSD